MIYYLIESKYLHLHLLIYSHQVYWIVDSQLHQSWHFRLKSGLSFVDDSIFIGYGT